MKFQIVNQILSKSFPAGKDFCPNSVENKNQIMKFWGFPKSGENFLSKYIFKKKKNF